MGRCKSCNETYKVIVVFVKTGKKNKLAELSTASPPENGPENKRENASETLPSWQTPSDSSLFGSTSEPFPGLSEALFGRSGSEQSSQSGSGSEQ